MADPVRFVVHYTDIYTFTITFTYTVYRYIYKYTYTYRHLLILYVGLRWHSTKSDVGLSATNDECHRSFLSVLNVLHPFSWHEPKKQTDSGHSAKKELCFNSLKNLVWHSVHVALSPPQPSIHIR